MSETKHTAGPWMIEGPSAGKLKVMDDGGDYAIVAAGKIIGEAFRRVGAADYAPALANARLIAAAPDLLKALRHVAEEIRGQRTLGTLKDESYEGRVYWAQVEGVARDAIAKVEAA